MQSKFANLTELADRYATDKGSVDGDRHLYTELYAACFESLRRQPFNLLELGLLRSPNRAEESDPASRRVNRIPSVDMWLEYFPKATCYGFDLADFSACDRARFKFIRGDLSQDADLELLAQSIPDPRIIVDDASHASFHQQRALLRLFPKLEPGGFYAIEDLHYSPPFEGSLPSCRPLARIVEEFLETGTLTLDFASAAESQALAEQIDHTFMHCSQRGRAQWGPKLVIFQKRRHGVQADPAAMARWAAARLAIDQDWLTKRMFAFRGGNNQLYAAGVRFEPNGTITGYRHQNEALWRYSGGQLSILRGDGVPSCIATPVRNSDGTVSFMGRFLLAPGHVVHRFDEIPGDDNAPMVFSFDLFDTLIARRCFEPKAIFQLVEEKSGVSGFARWRQEEEYKLWQAGDYTFDDIYEVLGMATGWPESTLSRLRMLELAEEWENIIPIKEMVERVHPGDLIVSDMYLPLSFLRRVVDEKCGLTHCEIYLSSHGKSRGEIWQRIRSTHRIMRHHGDNHHSDVEGARRANVSAEHIGVAHWTRGEKVLVEAGLAAFAKVIREARLTTWDTDITTRKAQLAQLDINIPLLIVSSLYVLKKAAEQDADTLLMCSRDCNLWYHLMKWFASRAPGAPRVRYFIASRVLLLSSSPEYRTYFAQLRGTRSLLVDVSGTGRSPAYFLESLGSQKDTGILLVAGTTQSANFVSEMAPSSGDAAVDILSEHEHEERLAVESLNMSLEGRAHQMAFTGHSFEAVRQPNEFGQVAQGLVSAMRVTFLDVLARIASADIRKVPDDIPVDVLRSAARTLIGAVGEYRRATAPILRDISQEEGNVARIALAERNRVRSNVA